MEATHTIRERVGPDDESLRRAIREELAAAKAHDRVGEAEEVQDRAVVRAEDVQAARAVVADAIAAGTWTETDRLRLGEIMLRLDREAQHDVLSLFSMAVNAQELAVEGLPP